MEFKKIEPNVWKPNAGDEITGKLVSVDREAGKFDSTIYHLETEANEQIAIWGSTVLDDRMRFLNVGDTVKIIYKGKEKNKNGQDVNIYEVFRGQIPVEKIS